MFKALKENKIIAISDTDNKFPCLVCDEIIEDVGHSVNDYVMVDSEFVLSTDDKAVENKKDEVRNIRNQYLTETDKYMLIDFPISDEEREQYKRYRQYLRNYTDGDSWWNELPKTFEEWKHEC